MATDAPVHDPLADGMAILERARQHFRAPADRAAIERVCRKLGIRLLAVFGSQATGRAVGRSDVDIAYLPEPNRRPGLLRLFGELVPALGSDALDLVDLRRASPLLAWNVMREGRLLYECEPGAWHDFCQRAMKEWDDARKFEKYRQMTLDRNLRSRGLIP